MEKNKRPFLTILDTTNLVREGGFMTQSAKQAGDASQNEERAIRELVKTWLAASEKGDLTTMLNLLADDVIFMVPGKEPFGRETFAQNFKQLKDTKIKTSSNIQEIKILGDWAWMRNFLRVTFTSSSGE